MQELKIDLAGSRLRTWNRKILDELTHIINRWKKEKLDEDVLMERLFCWYRERCKTGELIYEERMNKEANSDED